MRRSTQERLICRTLGKAGKILKKKKSFMDEMRSRETARTGRKSTLLLQQVMSDYAGAVRSQTMLEAGLAHLGRLKEEAASTMIARNQHELMRALEVLNLIELGELVCVAAMARKEQRVA